MKTFFFEKKKLKKKKGPRKPSIIKSLLVKNLLLEKKKDFEAGKKVHSYAFLFLWSNFVNFQCFSKTNKTPYGVFWNQKFLPSIWSLKNRWDWLDKKKRFDWGDIEISPCNLQITYRGLGRSDEDAASIRANKGIPSFVPLFYYEVKILSIGEFGYIGIGLCSPSVDLDRLPGWEKNSLGYHGDDGHAFRDSGTGIPYGPSFATGDVIGICFNRIGKKIFFTKNGTPLPSIFCDVFEYSSLPSFPMVGLRTSGETVEINFGRKPFEFDFNLYIQKLMYFSFKKVLFLGNFFIPNSFSNENSVFKSFFTRKIICRNFNPKEKILIFNQITLNYYFSTQKELICSFLREENLFFLNKGFFHEKFLLGRFEKMTELSLVYSSLNQILARIFFRGGKYNNKTLKNFIEPSQILSLKPIKKIFMGFLKLKRHIQNEKFLPVEKRLESNPKKSQMRNQPFFETRLKNDLNWIENFIRSKTLIFFNFFLSKKNFSSLKVTFDFSKLVIRGLKSKNSSNFSIFFLDYYEFFINLSSIIFWI